MFRKSETTYDFPMRNLIFITLLLPSFAFGQQPMNCATPMDCYELKKEKQDAEFRERELRLQEAQLKELQAQRAVMEEDLRMKQEEQIQKEEEELNKEENTGEDYALPGNQE